MTRQKEWCGDIIKISLQVGECQTWWPYSVATNVEICGHIFVNKMWLRQWEELVEAMEVGCHK